MMNYRFTNLLMFATGAAIGSVVTWKLLEAKYEQLVKEEIESVKEVFGRGTRSEVEAIDEDMSEEDDEEYLEAESQRCEELREQVNNGLVSEKPNLKEYAAKLAQEGYTDYSTTKKRKGGRG